MLATVNAKTVVNAEKGVNKPFEKVLCLSEIFLKKGHQISAFFKRSFFRQNKFEAS